MKIAIASDHGGFNLKSAIKAYLSENGYDCTDYGTDSLQSCDYPDFALAACEAITSGKCDVGILICTTGIGISISANKVNGIRCALCHNEDCAEFSRRHNNANALALGAKYLSADAAIGIVKVFLSTQFEGGRHRRRVDKITAIEQKYSK